MSIETLKNNYQGERVFLIGNGPSLDKTPLRNLKGEYSIGLNGINDIYSETSWRPSFYFLLQSSDKYEEYLRDNLDRGIKCITVSEFKPIFGEKSHIHYVKKKKLKYNTVEGECFHNLNKDGVKTMELQNLYKFWPNNVTERVYSYHTMYAVIQIAMYMGFDEIYLLGTDLGYGSHDPHMLFNEGLNPQNHDGGKTSFFMNARQEKVLIKSLINGGLFKILTSPIANIAGRALDYIGQIDDSNRFSTHSQIRPQDLTHVNDEIRKSHVAAKRIAHDQGVKIYNATLGGELEVYPRVGLETITDLD